MADNNITVNPVNPVNANPGDITVFANPAPGAPVVQTPQANPGAPAPAPAPQQVPQQPPPQPSIYGEMPRVPVLDAVEGIKFDFNEGIRIMLPQNGKEYRVKFSDIDTGIILYQADAAPGSYITSVKKFYIRFRLEIFNKGGEEPICTHDYDAKDREVMIQLPVGTIGDSVGWFSYVERFQQKHQCKLICVMTPWIADLVRDQYPDITFIAPSETMKYRTYACYYMGLFFRGNVDNQPIDFRYIGLHRTAG